MGIISKYNGSSLIARMQMSYAFGISYFAWAFFALMQRMSILFLWFRISNILSARMSTSDTACSSVCMAFSSSYFYFWPIFAELPPRLVPIELKAFFLLKFCGPCVLFPVVLNDSWLWVLVLSTFDISLNWSASLLPPARLCSIKSSLILAFYYFLIHKSSGLKLSIVKSWSFSGLVNR